MEKKLKNWDFDLSIDEQVVSISKAIMNCVDIFVPKKPMKEHSTSNEWITKKKNQNAIHKRGSLFQKWLSERSAEKHAVNKKCRNRVTKLIRDGKKGANQRQLEENPHQEKLNETLISLTNQEGHNLLLPDLKVLMNTLLLLEPRCPQK